MLSRVSVSNVFTGVFAHQNHDLYFISKERLTRHWHHDDVVLICDIAVPAFVSGVTLLPYGISF